MTTDIDPKLREILLQNHPVVTKEYTIITPMIVKVYSVIRERVFFRHSGTFLYAQPRMGKTHCARTVRDLVKAEFEDKYVLYHSADGEKSAQLIRDLHVSAGLPKRLKEPYSALMEKFIIHVRCEVECRGGRHFVLILDENQRLSTEDWDELLTVHNKLEDGGIKMTTLGFGQKEIVSKRELLFTVGSTQLIARFLSEPIRFIGCVSEEDMESILGEYDTTQEYPPDSKCCYTKFFLPLAFAAGFRIASSHHAIWLALVNLTGDDGPSVLPLEHVFRVIEGILVISRHMDDASFKITEGIIARSIDASLIRDFISLMKISKGGV